MNAKGGAVGIYLRISKDPLKLAAGVDRQRVDCVSIVAQRWPESPTIEYVDNDISASRYSRHQTRPAYTDMLADLASGTIHAIVAWDMDRLLRQPRDLESLIELCDEHKVYAVTTAQSDLDLSNPDGLFRARILAAVAAKESDDKSRRLRRVYQDRREKGQHHGSRVVFGYRLVDRVPVPVERDAALVREAARRVLDGGSLQSVARWLAETHGASRKPGAKEQTAGREGGSGGKPPRSGQGVRKMLSSPTLVSRTSSGARGDWPAILEDETYADLLALFGDPARRANAPSGHRVWWLTGLVHCAVCGTRCQIRNDRDGRHSYGCRLPNGIGCGSTYIRAEPLESHVELALFSVVDAYRESPAAPLPPSPDEDRLAELATLYATGDISRAEWQAARDALTRDLDSPAPISSFVPVDLEAEWDSFSPDQRHAHASRVIERIDIAPWRKGHGKWQPDRITIRWRATPTT